MELVASLAYDNESIRTDSTTATTNNHHHHHDEGKAAVQYNDTILYLDGPAIYSCAVCRTHLTTYDTIISKSFHGRNGRAYLFDRDVVNVTIGPAEERRLITGLHTVADISCVRCHTVVGWTYHKAYEVTQKYKEGKYIIETIYLHYEGNSTTADSKQEQSDINNTTTSSIINPLYTSPPPTSHGIMIMQSSYKNKDYHKTASSSIQGNHHHYHHNHPTILRTKNNNDNYTTTTTNNNNNNDTIIYEY